MRTNDGSQNQDNPKKKKKKKKKHPTTYKIIYTVRERSLTKQTHISTSESDNTHVIKGTSKTIISFVIIIF